MRKKLIWLVLFLFIDLFALAITMVSCNALGCSWEKATDSGRGLSRHRASCKFYHRSRVLASHKRLERTKAAARAASLVQSSGILQRGESGSSSVLVSGRFSTDIMNRTVQLSHHSRQQYCLFLTWGVITAPRPFFRTSHRTGGCRMACQLVQGIPNTQSNGSLTLIPIIVLTTQWIPILQVCLSFTMVE
jgi:hypothetical protein